MRPGVLRVAVAAAVIGAAACVAPAVAGTAHCPDASRANAGIAVGGNTAPTYEVTSASALNATSPDGDVALASFGYLYTTRGAGAYVEDGHPHGWIVPVDSTDPAAILKALAKLANELPPSKLSAGAKAVLAPGWKLTVLPCNAQK
ncbi:MAG TPA: hypothetical protein VK760_02195 [Candidatus Acidoferrales bacterium]|jgi:hypothetical protein|nr:hypothetical protein [Candidatus Acidoferrales bacterium]